MSEDNSISIADSLLCAKILFFILEISCLEVSKVKCVGRVIHKNSVSTECETLFLDGGVGTYEK